MKRILILILIFASFNLSAQEDNTYYNFIYNIQEEDSFASILRSFSKEDAVINKSTPLVSKIFKNNKDIKNWKDLKKGEELSLFFTTDILDMEKVQNYLNQKALKEAVIKKTYTVEQTQNYGLKGSLFYMASSGKFYQTSIKGSTINSSQNSLATIGGQGTVYPKDSLVFYSGSVYYSSFTSTTTELAPKTISFPAEIGFNTYGEYFWEKQKMSWHGGLDYEQFNSYNMLGIENAKKVYLDRTTVSYLTVGASKVVNLFKHNLYLKLSLSKSLMSSTTSEYSTTAKQESYTGAKVLFYINYKVADKYFVHSIIKYHQMSGPGELSTLRIGVGVGYILF